jgi:phosphonate transport system substrate-binding protein
MKPIAAVAAPLLVAVAARVHPAHRRKEKLRFAAGPFQPTASDAQKAYEPFFKYLAEKLGRDYELVVTTDCAGIAFALANKPADIAWMGPWDYVLADNERGAQAIATAKYNGKPSYHAIIVSRPDVKIAKWPETLRVARRCRLDLRLVDPDSQSVINGQVDLASDYDGNMDGFIKRGTFKADQVQIVWTSDPLPNEEPQRLGPGRSRLQADRRCQHRHRPVKPRTALK